MKILITHEKSQKICIAFRKRGHEAYSCDIQDCSGGHPEWHLKMDALEAITLQKWDIIIMHPVCTYMAVSGNAHYGSGRPLHYKRAEAITAAKWLWQKACSVCDFVAFENPVSVIFQHLTGGKLFYVQPHQFGHPESKKTGFYVKGLPELNPTNILPLPECGYWENQTPSGQNKLGPSPDRAEKRAETYRGIAEAIADQWGTFVENYKLITGDYYNG